MQISEESYNFFLFYPDHVIKAVFNRLNLRLSQTAGLLDAFLYKLCSSISNKISYFSEESLKLILFIYFSISINKTLQHFSFVTGTNAC